MVDRVPPAGSRSGRLATAVRATGGRGVPRAATPVLAALLALGLIAACGGDDAERDAAREELERRFGPRDTAGAAPAADLGAPASTSAETTSVADGAEEGPPRDERGDATDPGAGAGGPGAVETPSSRDPEPEPAAGDPANPPGPGDPTGAGGFDPDRWLAMADSAYRRLPSLRARFEQVVEVPLLDRTSTGEGIWYQRGRDRFRMDFTDPPDDLFVADGTHLWLYQPSQQPDQVVRTELAAGTAPAGTADLLGRILAEARTAYHAVYEGTETVSGAETHVIALTPRGPSEYRLVRVWIAAGDRLVRRFRIEQENEMVRTVTLAALEPGVALADSLFRFDVPEGVDVFEG